MKYWKSANMSTDEWAAKQEANCISGLWNKLESNVWAGTSGELWGSQKAKVLEIYGLLWERKTEKSAQKRIAASLTYLSTLEVIIQAVMDK